MGRQYGAIASISITASRKSQCMDTCMGLRIACIAEPIYAYALMTKLNRNTEADMAAELTYAVSMVDSDGDTLLEDALIQAPTVQMAWEQAAAIAFRACQGSGAVPSIISVRRIVPRSSRI